MEFLMALLVFPMTSFLFGIIGQILARKIFVVVGTTFCVWLVATFTIFNESFLIWVFIYSLFSLIGALMVEFVGKSKYE
ncbi:DUF2651 family protein [Gudongella sp. SC589]|uniref:DUF2651 family protein n=1 Tax=Gudongella sp. SC589 TaxID=3385990 RepID=UPI0039049DFB